MPIEWLIVKFTEGCWMNPVGWLVSHRLAELAGPWDERLSNSRDDDGEYICRVVAASGKVKFVPQAKCYYRIGNPNSLSWMNSNKALESLFLATSLCISHLRSLEDSERTRAACIKFLQNRLLYFYPDKYGMVEKAEKLAQDLGGHLLPPKTYIRKNWDRLIYELGNLNKPSI
jgi:hypothetical protein